MDKNKIIKVLSEIFDLEISGVVRYTHYSLMIFGSDRLPLVTYFRSQATESLDHANLAGEHITGLGGHPPLNNDNLKETFNADVPLIQAIENFEPVYSDILCSNNSTYLPADDTQLVSRHSLTYSHSFPEIFGSDSAIIEQKLVCQNKHIYGTN